jgi:hypothetical protein
VRLVIAIALAASGCGNKTARSAPSCEQAATLAIDGMTKHMRGLVEHAPPDTRVDTERRMRALESVAPRLRAVIANHCVDDKWPSAVIECYAKATHTDDMRGCRDKLSPEMQAKLQKDELDLMADVNGPPAFGKGTTPTSPEIRRLQGELRELNGKLADAQKKVADAPNEADRDAAKDELLRLQAEMHRIDEQLAAERARFDPGAPTPP